MMSEEQDGKVEHDASRIEGQEPGAMDLERPPGEQTQEARGHEPRGNLHLSASEDVAAPSSTVPEPEPPPASQNRGPSHLEPGSDPLEEPSTPEDRQDAPRGPWAMTPAQALARDTEAANQAPQAKPEPPSRTLARQHRVEAALARQKAMRDRVYSEKERMVEEGVRICGGERVEDCMSNEEPTPRRQFPVFEPEDADEEPTPTSRLPWVPAEEARQIALAPGNGITPRRAPGKAITQDDMMLFLEHYAKTGLFNHSAYAIGRAAWAMRQHMKKEPAFEQMVAEAYQVYRERIAYEVHVRAVDGVVKPVFGKEGQVGWVREFDSRLLELQAKAVWPERYREQPATTLDKDIKFGVLVVPAISKTPEEWEALHGAEARGLPEPIEPSNPGPRIEGPIPMARPKVTRPVGPRSGGVPSR